MKYLKGASLEEWIDKNNLRTLEDQIRCNFENYLCDGGPPTLEQEEDIKSLIRLNMIMIREHIHYE
jgi:hypothetical protein